MQLTYRGTQYNMAPAYTSSAYTDLTAIYRGARYPILKSNAVATVPTKTLKYRGIVIGTPEVIYQPASRPAMA